MIHVRQKRGRSLARLTAVSNREQRRQCCYFRKDIETLTLADIVIVPANKECVLNMVSHQSRRPHGRTIRDRAGYAAFVPAPLPPPIAWEGELVAALSSADRAIGELAGEGRRFPNPHLIISPFVRREAVLSSRIEGTRTTLAELLAAEAGAVVERASEDLDEVINYVEALEYGLRRLDTLPLSLRADPGDP